MNPIEQWIVKAVGQHLDMDLQKWGFSKAKIAAWLGVLLIAAPKIGAALGYNFTIPQEVFDILAAFGLWGLHDDHNTQTVAMLLSSDQTQGGTPK